MKVYLAGKMTDLPYFDAEAFDYAAALLRNKGFEVFSPVEHDREIYGPELFDENPTGDPVLARINHGFCKRKAMDADLAWICRHADAIALLPGWETSSGVAAELATAKSLGLTIIHLGKEFVE